MEEMKYTNFEYGDSYLHEISIQMASFYTQPDKYLDPTSVMSKELLSVSKKMYDFMKEFEIYSSKKNSLNELLISGFDNEQIWQEIQLQNNPCIPRFKGCLNGLNFNNISLCEQKLKIEEKHNKKKQVKSGVIKNGVSDTENIDNEDDEDESNVNFDEEDNFESLDSEKKYKATIVDDNFFRLREMEEMIDKQEQLDEAKDHDDDNKQHDEEIDFFDHGYNDDEESDGFTREMYTDFFDEPDESNNKKDKSNKEDNGNDETADEGFGDESMEEEGYKDDDFEDLIGDEEDEEEEEAAASENEEVDHGNSMEEETLPKSAFERKQKHMEQKIKKLEEENLAEKPWQLMGETSAKKRPMNSLLEEFMTFDHTSVGAPEITEETTLTLEDLIKQRIKDQAWDDVVRKEKPVLQPYEYKKAPELNQEKSKISLAEVYEKEYLKQAEDNKEEKENENHVTIRNLMDRLFVQLDALSNFHFTPKPPRPEIKVITNAPSLQMEEVLPITMTEASQLAPEEVFDKKKGELVGTEEKTDEDRKRDRRQKKIKKKFSAKAKERKEKLKAKSGKVGKSDKKLALDALKKGVRNTIVTADKETDKGVKSSSAFFSKLQDEVKKGITKEHLKGKKMSTMKTKKSAEFLKL